MYQMHKSKKFLRRSVTLRATFQVSNCVTLISTIMSMEMLSF